MVSHVFPVSIEYWSSIPSSFWSAVSQPKPEERAKGMSLKSKEMSPPPVQSRMEDVMDGLEAPAVEDQ